MCQEDKYDNDTVGSVIHIEICDIFQFDVMIPIEGSKERDRHTDQIQKNEKVIDAYLGVVDDAED